MEDFITTSKSEAELLAFDRLVPFMFQLRQRIETRITTEWIKGKKIQVELTNEMDEAVAEIVADEYRKAGWTVTITGRTNSTKKWLNLT